MLLAIKTSMIMWCNCIKNKMKQESNIELLHKTNMSYHLMRYWVGLWSILEGPGMGVASIRLSVSAHEQKMWAGGEIVNEAKKSRKRERGRACKHLFKYLIQGDCPAHFLQSHFSCQNVKCQNVKRCSVRGFHMLNTFVRLWTRKAKWLM